MFVYVFYLCSSFPRPMSVCENLCAMAGDSSQSEQVSGWSEICVVKGGIE